MNSRQKIGVLTFHGCINYGSYWQARCLVEGLRARGHEAVLLDYEARRITHAEWRCALRPVLPTPVPREDYARYSDKIRKFLAAFAALPLSPRFDLEQPATMEEYDTVVVGSDEVWNLCHPWYSGCPLFFGDGLKAKRLVAYAASFGTYHAWGGLGQEWSDKLRNFAAISVRDENSWWLIKNALGFEPDVVLDPCLQFPPQLEGEWQGPSTPFVAVYGHNFSPWFSGAAQGWAKARGYRLVSIGYRNDWADEQWLEAGPQDFAQSMARAQAVATNFFHGCVFALLNCKPFVCEVTPYRSIKIQNLMAMVGGENHLVEAAAPAVSYDAALGQPVAPDVLERIDHLRQSSQAYLDQALL